MERFKVCFSDNADFNMAYAEVANDIKSVEKAPILIIFYSDFTNFSFYVNKFDDDFENTEVIGTSTYLSHCKSGYSQKALSAVAIYDGIECSTGILYEIDRFPMRYAQNITNALDKISSVQNTVCFEITSACNSEEIVQDTFKSVLANTKIPVFGGSSSTNSITDPSYISLNGEIYDCACVFAFIKNLNGKIGLYKENIFKPTAHVFTATDVDCNERIVYEYDGKPAAEAIADALSISVEELNDNLFMHPVGRIDGDEIYIVEAEKIIEDNAIACFARIYNRTKVALLEADNLDEVWSQTAKKVHSDFDKISFTFLISCFSRSKYFLSLNIFDEFNRKMSDEYGNFLDFSGFGEQYNFEHFNQTMVLCVFE